MSLNNWKVENEQFKQKIQADELKKQQYVEEAMKILIVMFNDPNQYQPHIAYGNRVERTFIIKINDPRNHKITNYRPEVVTAIHNYLIQNGFKNCGIDFQDMYVSSYESTNISGHKLTITTDP